MKKPLAAAALLWLATWPASAQDKEADIEPMRVEGSARWGTIKELREPEYPYALKDSKARMLLDISGIVSYSGELTQAEFNPGSEDAQHMIEPMRKALRLWWRFVTPVDRRCQPSGAPIKTRVYFDFSTNPPSLSTQTPDEAKKPAYKLEAVTRVEPDYPNYMTMRVWGSVVFARLKIDPAGNVTDVLAIAYPKGEIDLTPFSDSAIRALRQWKLNPDAEAKRDRYGCMVVFYVLPPRERKRR